MVGVTTTVLTDEQIDAILASPGDMRWVIATKKERYVLFARAIEQAVLQSAQVQAWKKDAETFKSGLRVLIPVLEQISDAVEIDLTETKISVAADGNELASVSISEVIAKLRAAMEEQ